MLGAGLGVDVGNPRDRIPIVRSRSAHSLADPHAPDFFNRCVYVYGLFLTATQRLFV
jgi:hypothetical protein